MSRSRNLVPIRSAIPWAVGAAALVGAHAVLGLPERTMFQTALLNAGHAPLYAAFAGLVLQAARRAGAARPYVWAGLVSLAAGSLTEVAQIGSTRAAEWQDLARNCLGAAAGLLLAYSRQIGLDTRDAITGTADQHGGRRLVTRRSGVRSPVLAAAIAGILLAISFADLASVSAAYLARDRAFPVICQFGSRWSAVFVKPASARLDTVPAPEAWNAADGSRADQLAADRDDASSGGLGEAGAGRRGGLARGRGTGASRVARVTFLPAEYPGLQFREVHPDWRGYARLVLNLYSELPDTVRLELRVNDDRHNEDYHDRFNRTLAIVPGANTVIVSLEDVRLAPRTREMEMSRIRTVVLFAFRTTEPFALYLRNLHLERDSATHFSKN